MKDLKHFSRILSGLHPIERCQFFLHQVLLQPLQHEHPLNPHMRQHAREAGVYPVAETKAQPVEDTEDIELEESISEITEAPEDSETDKDAE